MGISGWQLIILLVIVVLVFGTKRLRNVGSDLGGAVKGFRKGLQDEDEDGLTGANDEDDSVQLGADAGPAPHESTKADRTRSRDI